MGSSPTFVSYLSSVFGVWRSWLAYLFWEQKVRGSSPFTPIFLYKKIMDILHFGINFLLIIFGFLVLLSTNPIHSVLFLILSFCCASITLVLFGLDFLAVLFVIVYVGAIAVLFLFVVMMLNVKLYTFNSLPQTLFIGVILFFIFSQTYFFLNELFNTSAITLKPEHLFDTFSNIDIFGQVLYNYFLICFLLAGLILLVAMVGAISLTLTFKSNRKNELVFRQLSRSENFLTFFN